MNHHFLIGTGWFSPPHLLEQNQKFSDIWYQNVCRYAPDCQIVCVAVGRTSPNAGTGMQVVRLEGNAGHVGDLLDHSKPYDYCGWSATVLALAWICYNNESDFIFLEQDALAFGPWVEQMYEELGDGKVIFGSTSAMPAAQSLFLVKHDYIPTFCRLYLELGADHLSNRGTGEDYNLPEKKFATLEKSHPNEWRRFSFGFDRDRPYRTTDKVFYVQKVTSGEVSDLKEKGLL